jgi:hypothetical protein
MPRHSPAAQSLPATTGCIKRGTVVQGDSKSWEQYPLSLTPDVRHSLQALALCKMLVERGININHGDVAWSNLEVKLQGQWPSWNRVPTYVKGFDKIRLPTPGLNLSQKTKMIHILLAYFHLRGRNRFSKWFPISFEMWVAGVQEMHEGRETKLLPIQLGRRPSSSKPGAFKHVIPNSRKLQSLGAGGWYPNYLLVSSNCHPLVSELSLRCSHLSPTVSRLPCRCGLAIVSCLPIVP